MAAEKATMQYNHLQAYAHQNGKHSITLDKSEAKHKAAEKATVHSLTSIRTPKGETSPKLCSPVCSIVPSMAGVHAFGRDSSLDSRTPDLL